MRSLLVSGAGLLLIATLGCKSGVTVEQQDSTEFVRDGVRTHVVADATIRADQPATNFGTRRELSVEKERDKVKQFLLRLAVEGVGDRQVISAELHLRCSNPASSGGDFHLTNGGWDEYEVTWNNAPAAGEFIASLGEVSRDVHYIVDLSSVITGDGVYDFKVQSRAVEEAGFRSREYRTDAPQLRIEVASTGGEQTPGD